MIPMALLALVAGGALLAGGALGALVGHPSDPYVYYPPPAPAYIAPYCSQPYFYPMMGTGTWMSPGGTGLGSAGVGPGFYPWSPTPWSQPPIFGYW